VRNFSSTKLRLHHRDRHLPGPTSLSPAQIRSRAYVPELLSDMANLPVRCCTTSTSLSSSELASLPELDPCAQNFAAFILDHKEA
jgi:hypothetical protein